MKHNKIKELRIKKGFSQEDIAQVLHVSQNAYSLIENGKTRLVDVERILLISEKFSVNPIELGLFDEVLNISEKNQLLKLDKSAEEIIETLKTDLSKNIIQIKKIVSQNSKLLSLLNKSK